MKSWQKAKNLVKYIVRKYFGYDLSVLKIKLSEDYLEQKKLFASAPAGIIFDVGANAGQTTHKYRKMFPKASIHGFEPFPRMFGEYVESVHGDKKVHCVNIALSNQNGTAEFFVNSFHGCNSLLQNNEEFTKGKDAFQKMGKIEVNTETLDSYCEKNKIERINILKMDVQGGELLVLQGTEKMLSNKKIDLIYTEVMYMEVYKNQPLFSDIKKFLEQFGYRLHKSYGLIDKKTGQPTDGDVIFIKYE